MIQKASPWTSAEVALATGGELNGSSGRALSGVSTDTRDALSGALFVALSGERYDAHDLLGTAISAGAAALLVSHAGWARAVAGGFVAPSPDLPIIRVADTLYALGELGKAHRRRSSARVLALTGSNGKTSTKELLAAILSVSHRVLKTEGNLNNLIGVPMTLLGLAPEHELAVVEMGMNAPGEVARYTEIAEPDLGLVINVGPAHIGNLGSLQAIGDAKGELFHGLDRARAVAVANLDDPEVMRVARAAKVERLRTFGWSAGADVRLLEYAPTFDAATGNAGGRARVSIDGYAVEVEVPFAGKHNAMNAAGAIAAATAELDGRALAGLEAVVLGLPRAKSVGRRLAFEKVGPYLLVDDCYNANSASMLAGIETVAARAKSLGARFVAVLGEMRELGDHAPHEHQLVGEALVREGAAVAAVFGDLARPIADAARAGGAAVSWEPSDADALGAWLARELRDGDVVLVKGSRGSKMERFVDRIRQHAGVAPSSAGVSH